MQIVEVKTLVFPQSNIDLLVHVLGLQVGTEQHYQLHHFLKYNIFRHPIW